MSELYTIEYIHFNGTITIQLRGPSFSKRINIRRITPYRWQTIFHKPLWRQTLNPIVCDNKLLINSLHRGFFRLPFCWNIPKGWICHFAKGFHIQQLFPLSSCILMHGECAFAMEGKSDVTTRIFGYIQYISRNDKYPICIMWLLTTMEFWWLVISRLLGYICEPREQCRT